MKGTIDVLVKNNRVQYKFSLKRNLTILRGDSATGKTSLIEMIEAYENDRENSGISLLCDKNCTVISGRRWKENLGNTKDSIVLIDEGNDFLSSTEFADAAKNSDNYYVIATREPLPNLPYSVDEIYGITNTTRKKYNKITRLYSQFERIYSHNEPVITPDLVIVEDSNAGYQFFSELFRDRKVPCVSAGGKSNIFRKLAETSADKKVLIIADGAAFGPEIERVMRFQPFGNVVLFLPESFEWLILKSGLVEGARQVLDAPSEYIESKQYFSWERFFNAFLTEKTRDSYLEYSKKVLNENYLQKREKAAITETLPEKLRR